MKRKIIALISVLVLSGCSASVKDPKVSISYVYITQPTEETTAKVVTTVSETEEAVTTEAPPPPYAKTTSEYKEELVANFLLAFVNEDKEVVDDMFANNEYNYNYLYNSYCKFINEDLGLDYKTTTLSFQDIVVFADEDNAYIFDLSISNDRIAFIRFKNFDYNTGTYRMSHGAFQSSGIIQNSYESIYEYMLNNENYHIIDITPYLASE